ncbi:MAG: hypothetical protein ABJM06_12320 [Gilvibacter sp.]
MNSKFLFHNKYKKWGWLIFIPTAIASFIVVAWEVSPAWLDTKVFAIAVDEIFGDSKSFSFIDNNILNEILGVLMILSGLLLAFSKEKDEDEYIAQIRLSSLVWATYVNYAVLLLAFIFVYDLSFLWVMIFNMFTILVFFIVRFNYKLYQLKKSASHD